jgi:hypothetical protein
MLAFLQEHLPDKASKHEVWIKSLAEQDVDSPVDVPRFTDVHWARLPLPPILLSVLERHLRSPSTDLTPLPTSALPLSPHKPSTPTPEPVNSGVSKFF